MKRSILAPVLEYFLSLLQLKLPCHHIHHITLLCLILLSLQVSFAQEPEDDIFMEDDIFIDIDTLDIAPVEQKKLELGGFLEEKISYSFDHSDSDFSQIITRLGLNAKFHISEKWKARFKGYGQYDLSYITRGRSDFTDEILDDYEERYEIEECFIEGYITDWLYVGAGRQIISWGNTEGEQITDIVVPRDMLEPGLLDVEDMRLSVTTVQLSLIKEAFELNLLAIPEIRESKIGPKGSEFDYYKSLRKTRTYLENEEVPGSSIRHMEFLARLSWSLKNSDIHIIFGDVYDDRPYLDFSGYKDRRTISLVPRHKRIQVFGLYGNYVTGPWLFKTEQALKLGKPIPRTDLQSQTMLNPMDVKTYKEKDVVQSMIGFEYNGFSNLYVIFEFVSEKIFGHEDILLNDTFNYYSTIILTYDAFRETLNTELLWSYYPQNNEHLLRLKAEYDITDNISINAGLVVYTSYEDRGLLYGFRNNDRVSGGIKYSF